MNLMKGEEEEVEQLRNALGPLNQLSSQEKILLSIAVSLIVLKYKIGRKLL